MTPQEYYEKITANKLMPVKPDFLREDGTTKTWAELNEANKMAFGVIVHAINMAEKLNSLGLG